ncbi:MAG: hypothetical protein K1X75_07760 [Leptospirales bacterium]|nr:hypothetical protein [Leptospirales bacterium]
MIALLLNACIEAQLQSPAADRRVVLASPEAACETIGEFSRWYLLFGVLPLPWISDSPEFSTADNRSMRIQEKISWLDAAITLGGGWLLSLTRRTLELQSCEEHLAVVGAAERQAELQSQLDALMRGAGRVVLHLQDESIRSGRVVEISADEIVLERDDIPATPAAVFDRVTLKTGQVLEGKITNQTANSVVIDLGGRTRRLLKRDIARIDLSVAAGGTNAAQSADQMLHIPRAQIVRIALHQ